MNKRFSTLVAAFAAIATVSYAQIGDKYVHVQVVGGNYLTITKENPTKADSVKIAALGSTKAALDSALWMPKFVEKMTSGDSVFQFVNKATKKNLSFAVKKNGAGNYGTMIADGVDKFVFKNGVSAGSEIYAAYGKDTLVSLGGSGTLVVAKDLTGASKFTLVAPAAQVLKTVAELTGKLATFKLDFNGKEGGLFAEELIPVVAPNDKFRFQVAGQEKSTKGTKADQYITIDTVAVGGSVKAATFKLDTLVTSTNTNGQYGGSNEGLQTFKLTMDLGNDSITITTDSIVRFDAQGKYEIRAHEGVTTNEIKPYVIGHKDFVGSTALVVDSMQIIAPFITISKGTPVKLAGGTGVYSLQIKANGGNTYADYNDMFLTGNGDVAGVANSVAAASEYVPSTQFYVKENADGTYSIQGREASTVSAQTGANGETYGTAIASLLLDEEPLFAVDAENGVYHLGKGNDLDTLVFTKLDVDLANKYIGYKYYTKEEMGYGAVKFNLASKAADDIYLALTKDSVIAGAKGAGNAVELRLIEGAEIAQDTVYYGAQALGDSLIRVAYAMEKAYNADGRKLAYEAVNAVNVVKLSKKAALQDKRFFFVENPAGESYKVVEAAGTSGQMVTLNISDLAVTYAAPTAAVETYFNIEGAEAPVYSKVESGHYNVVNGTEMLTATGGIAKLLRVGDELKAAAEDSDFSLYIDSAYVNRGDDNTEYGYYIYKGAEVKNDTIVGTALSAKGKFVAGTATGDSAIFCGVTVVADTLYYDGNVDKKGNPIKSKVTDASNTSVVGFKVVDGEGYEIVALNTGKKLAVVNGTVIFSTTVAPQVFTMAASEAPTANETAPSVSEVTVIATDGGVQIVGAAGKKVVVSNILGQTIANTVLSSDNATIAAPQGVVVVAVEGEEAVKAIVK